MQIAAIHKGPDEGQNTEAQMGSGNSRFIAAIAAAMVASSVAMYACQAGPAGGAGGTADAAQAVYVPPGEYDEFYAFMSGGFSGNLTVMGLPSGRLLKQVPVFSQYPENG